MKMKKLFAIIILCVSLLAWTAIPTFATMYGTSVFNLVPLGDGVYQSYSGQCSGYSGSAACGIFPDNNNVLCYCSVVAVDDTGNVIGAAYSAITPSSASCSDSYSTYAAGGYFSFNIGGASY